MVEINRQMRFRSGSQSVLALIRPVDEPFGLVLDFCSRPHTPDYISDSILDLCGRFSPGRDSLSWLALGLVGSGGDCRQMSESLITLILGLR